MSKPLKLNTKLPESVYQPPKMNLQLPKELTDALTLLVGRMAGGAPAATAAEPEPGQTRKPSEVQQAGSYDLQIHRDGPFLLIDRVVATERASGQPKWQFDVHRGPQSQIENIEAVRL